MTALRVYSGPRDLLCTLTVIGDTMAGLLAEQQVETFPTTAKEKLAVEQRLRVDGLSITDLCIAGNVIRAHMDVGIRKQAAADTRQRYRQQGITRRIKNKGWSPVTIVLPGGLRLKMKTPYLRPSRKGVVGRPRGSGKRGEGGVGAYPMLERLGIEVGTA